VTDPYIDAEIQQGNLGADRLPRSWPSGLPDSSGPCR
jgi:hypothetical protein